MDEFLRWLPVALLVINFFIAWGLWSLKKQFVSHSECSANRENCGNNKNQADEKASVRLNKLEADVNALPTRLEFIDLSNKMGDMVGELGKLRGRLGGVNRAVDLLSQHHLQEKL